MERDPMLANDPVSETILSPKSATVALHPSARESPKSDVKFRFVMAGDIQINALEEWAIDGILPKQGTAILYGEPGTGKSFLALDAAMHVAAGRDWFGLETQQGGVVYIAAEAGEGLKKRIVACRRARDFTAHVPFALVPMPANLGGKDSKDCETLIADIKRQLPAIGGNLAMVVIDTLHRSLGGADENSASEISLFLSNAAAIQEAFGCVALLVHHEGKDATRGMRGSSALHGAADVEWQTAGVGAGEIKTVTLKKNKEGKDGLVWKFALGIETVYSETVERAGKQARLVSVDSCFVQEIAHPAPSQETKKQKPLTGTRGFVFDRVKLAIQEFGSPLPQSDDFPTGKGVTISKIKDICIKDGIGNPENPKSQAVVVNREVNSLAGDKRLVRHADWVWLP